MSSTWASATARCSAGTRRCWRRRPRRPSTPSCAQRMGAAAVAAAKAIGYSNAGTVEFLLGADGALLLPGDEHAPAGRASRHRVRHRASTWSSCRSASPPASRCRFAQDDVRFARPRHRGAALRRGAARGFPAAVGPRSPPGGRRRARHPRRPRPQRRPGHQPLLRSAAGQDHRARGHARGGAPPADPGAGGHDRARHRHQPRLPHRLPAPRGVRRRQRDDAVHPRHFAKRCDPATDAAALALAAVLWFEASARRHGHDPARAWSSSGALAWPLQLDAGGRPARAHGHRARPRPLSRGRRREPHELELVAVRCADGRAISARRRGASARSTPSTATPCT